MSDFANFLNAGDELGRARDAAYANGMSTIYEHLKGARGLVITEGFYERLGYASIIKIIKYSIKNGRSYFIEYLPVPNLLLFTGINTIVIASWADENGGGGHFRFDYEDVNDFLTAIEDHFGVMIR